ncbi:MAG TPA: RES family NAD+ phosphorylase [Candidatus Limnocylindrales bacterium]
MAATPPPTDCPSADGPKIEVLPAGSLWWRIHRTADDPISFRDIGALAKRATPARYGEEGRFDCQAGEYGYLYLGETKKSAIAEAFLRGPVVKDPAARFMRRSRADGRMLSRLEFEADLPLVDLRGAAGLGRIGQDAWLSACDEPDYPITQQWATAIRRWAADAAGLVWMSKRDNVHTAAILFANRVNSGAISGRPVRTLDDPLGTTLLAKVLSEFNVVLG